METFELPNVALNVIVLVFIIGIIWFIGNLIIGVHMHPLMKSLNPNNTQGITGNEYETKANFFWSSSKLVWYILIAIPFVYIILKLLYEKERTSVPYGGYGY